MTHNSQSIRVMECRGHLKNAASPKSHMSRGNKLFTLKSVVFFVALFVVSSAFAQVKFGIKAGGNLTGVSGVSVSASGININLLEKDGWTAGYHGGVFANISLSEMIGIQPELLFSMQGGKHKPSDLFSEVMEFDVSEATLSYQLGYINVPLLLEIKPVANLGILVGPQIGYNVYRKATFTDDGEKESISGSEFDDDFMPLKKFDAGLTTGLQYKIGENLYVGLQYYHGLINSWNETENGATIKGFRHGVIRASIGFVF